MLLVFSLSLMLLVLGLLQRCGIIAVSHIVLIMSSGIGAICLRVVAIGFDTIIPMHALVSGYLGSPLFRSGRYIMAAIVLDHALEQQFLLVGDLECIQGMDIILQD